MFKLLVDPHCHLVLSCLFVLLCTALRSRQGKNCCPRWTCACSRSPSLPVETAAIKPSSEGATESRHAGLQAACHSDVAPCICVAFTRWLACVHSACLSVRGQCACEIQLLFEIHYSKREQSSPCRNGGGRRVPSAIVVLMSKSSGEDCVSDELKAAASPRASICIDIYILCQSDIITICLVLVPQGCVLHNLRLWSDDNVFQMGSRGHRVQHLIPFPPQRPRCRNESLVHIPKSH